MNDIVLARPEPGALATAVAELSAVFGDRLVTSRAVREQHGNTTTWIACAPPDAVVFPQSTEEVQQAVRICAAHGVPVIPFGVGVVLRGQRQRDLRRCLARPQGHEPGARGPPRGLRLRRRTRHHPYAAQRSPARSRPVLLGRSRRGRLPRRHGLDPCLGDDDRPLRHDEGQRARAEGRAGQRRADVHRAAGAKVVRRLRPHPADRRRRGNAWGHHRIDPEAPRHSRGDRGGGLPIPVDR